MEHFCFALFNELLVVHIANCPCIGPFLKTSCHWIFRLCTSLFMYNIDYVGSGFGSGSGFRSGYGKWLQNLKKWTEHTNLISVCLIY